LLPALAAAGGVEDPVIGRVLHDHAEIRLEALRILSGLISLGQQHELGELLVCHVRLEGRELFAAIETAVNPEQLSELGAAISAAERRRA
jgi:hypothetical protein